MATVRSAGQTRAYEIGCPKEVELAISINEPYALYRDSFEADPDRQTGGAT